MSAHWQLLTLELSNLSYHIPTLITLLLSLPTSRVALVVIHVSNQRTRVLVRNSQLPANARGLRLLKHWGPNCLLALLTTRRSIDHLLLLHQDVVHPRLRVSRHATGHPVRGVVGIHWHLTLIYEFVIADDTHVAWNCTYLLIVVELGRSIGGTHSAKSLIRSDRVIS